MKRLALLLSAFAVALSFNACEQHTAAELPEHYQHKGAGHHEAAGAEHSAGHGEKAPADHSKPEHK